jgi:hypothetical protein
MKTIAFHSNQLGIRGTEVALFDYAHYNETLLGNKSYIISDSSKDLQALQKFKDRFEVFLYDKFEDCFSFVKEKGISHMYYIKAGDKDGKLVPGIKNLVHAVFQHKDAHGDKYCYNSEWLAASMGAPGEYVPHIVDMPVSNKNYRDKLKISSEHIVIGRHGGFGEFDLPFVHSTIYQALEFRPDLIFVFMNTKQFGPPHPNIRFVEGTYNLQHKSNYINTCDYMIHARGHGESFGLALSEFLFHDKPVISWSGGLDKNHVTLMNERGIWYSDGPTLLNVLIKLQHNSKPPGHYKCLVEPFAPQNAMAKFNEKFLS